MGWWGCPGASWTILKVGLLSWRWEKVGKGGDGKGMVPVGLDGDSLRLVVVLYMYPFFSRVFLPHPPMNPPRKRKEMRILTNIRSPPSFFEPAGNSAS